MDDLKVFNDLEAGFESGLKEFIYDDGERQEKYSYFTHEDGQDVFVSEIVPVFDEVTNPPDEEPQPSDEDEYRIEDNPEAISLPEAGMPSDLELAICELVQIDPNQGLPHYDSGQIEAALSKANTQQISVMKKQNVTDAYPLYHAAQALMNRSL